jgi:asparagine synthase (glutamine-hydrolysing)
MNSIKGQFIKKTIVCADVCSQYLDDQLEVVFLGQIFLPEISHNPCKEPSKYIAGVYKEFGYQGFRKLDGTYLTIIRDGASYYMNRDRFGSGPQLFYTSNAFATNINELLELSGFLKEPNLEGLAGFLKFGYIPSPLTGLKGVSKLPGGQVLIWKGSGAILEDLYTWQESQSIEINSKITMDEAVDTYSQLHQKAIRKRIAGAEKVGVLLSGGYDSCGNIAALRKVYDGRVLSFTVGFKDNPWSEVPLAKMMAEKFGAEFHHSDIDGNEITNLPQLVRQLGDPFQEGGLMVNFAAMKLASGYPVDIMLGGDGNDQHHGTSGKELAMHLFASKSGLSILQKAFYAFDQSRTILKDNKEFRLAFHNRKILNILYNDAFGFGSGELKAMGLADAPAKGYGIQEGLNDSKSFDDLFFQHNYFVDVKQVINEVILFKAGQNAAFRNIPLAFPYMDREISEFLVSLPRELRFSGTPKEVIRGYGKSKFIHKRLYQNDLPKEVSGKKKQGGFAPLTIFFRSDSNIELVRQVILGSGICKNILNETWISGFIDSYKSYNSKKPYWFWYSQLNAFRLFNLLVLAVWWETIMNDKTANQLSDLL